MCAAPSSRRTVAEINSGGGAAFNIGNRSIHQFWHLFSANFRSVLLPPQRRADSGNIAWTWREPAQNSPPTAQELAAIRQRLADGSRLLGGGGKGKVLIDDAAGNIDAQVREKVGEMVAQLIAKGDQALAGFVCRTETGLMIHSWGAATPAAPHYPGTSEGVVSGTVLLGENRPAGLTVVLENRTGGFVARTKSGDAGAFSFPNVAPGAYRVRVTGREGFPAGGVAVTMERESVGGIELRGKAQEDGTPAPISAATMPPMAVETTPSRLPRLVGWLALLALFIGGGIYFWRTTGRPAAVAPDNSKPSGWQSASGQLAGGTREPVTTDARKVGSDGRFSELSAAPSLPNMPGLSSKPGIRPLVPTAVSSKNPASKNDPLTSAAASPESSPPPGSSVQPEKSAQPVSSGKSPKNSAAPAKDKTDRAPKNKTPPTDNPTDPKEPASTETADDSATAPAAKTAAASAAKAKTKAPNTATASGPSFAGETANDAPPSGEAGSPSAASTASSVPAANKSANPAASKKPKASGANNAASTAEADAAPAGPSDSPAPGADAASSAQSSAGKPPSPAKTPSANADAAVATPAAAETAPPGAEANPSDNSPSPDSSPAKNSPKTPAAAKRPAGAAPAGSSPPADTTPPDDSTADNPAPTTPAKPPAKPAPSRAPKTTPASQEANAAPVQSDDTAAPLSEPESTSPASGTKSSARPKAPQKNSPPAAPTSDASTDEPPATPADSSSGNPPVIPIKTSGQDQLTLLAHVTAAPWKSRQVRDLILPTQPVPAAEDDAVQVLREKLRQEQRARIPQTFRQPVVTSGFAVEFLPSKSIGQPRWHDATGGEPAGATVQDNRAEITWAGPNPAGPIDCVLSYPGGPEIAHVRTDDGAPSLSVGPDVRGWYWVGIARSPADDAASAPAKNESRLTWRFLSGATVPAAWPQRVQWAGGQGHRLELPLGLSSDGKRPYALALVDQLTGWALVSEVRVQ